MALQKEKSNLGGNPVSPGNRILGESAKENTSKRHASHLPDPEMEPGSHKERRLDKESIHKGGSSTATEELHVVDESDGSRWIIQDKTVIDQLRRYKSASDEKTKDEIVKFLQSYVASLSKKSNISQASKNSSNECSSHRSPTSNAACLSRITEKIQHLKLDGSPQKTNHIFLKKNSKVFMSSTKIQASQSDKQLQDPKNGGAKGGLDGNRMDVDKNSSPQPSMPSSVRLPRDGK